MNVHRSAVSRLCLAVALIAAAQRARADDFPTRPIKLIVQTSAGSSLDVMARLIAAPLSQVWKQQAIVVNQAGAGGLIASRALAAAPADGYTLFLAGGSVFVALPVLSPNLPFDVTEFMPAGFVAEQPYTLLASKGIDVKSTKDLIEYSKKQSGGMDTVAGTRGGLQHLTVELFRKRSGAKLNMIHYPGPAQAMNDFLTGRVPMMMQTLAPVAGVINSGEAKLLAIASEKRLPSYPDTPTVSEALPGFTSSGWSILVAPKGTPMEVVHKINADLRVVLARPDVIQRIEQQGNYTRPMTPQQLSEFVRNERATWVPIVKEIGKAEH
jgi:tripartite-type tricarboxylate transporter receptor subunit TctC